MNLSFIVQSLQTIPFSIFIGVLSGLLTALLLFFFGRLITKVIIPWYQNYVFRGLDVSGNWTSEFSYLGSVISQQVLELEQRGHLLKGQLSSTYKTKKPNIIVNYHVSGEIFDNYVFMRYKPINKKHLGGGSVMLKIVEGGGKLEGGLVAIDRFSTNIMIIEKSIWSREI